MAHPFGNLPSGIRSNSKMRFAGDVNSITVGDNTNLQDGVVVHVAKTALGSPCPTIIGHNVTVGASIFPLYMLHPITLPCRRHPLTKTSHT